MTRFVLLTGLIAFTLPGWAQRVRVYSPFTRVDPFGEIVQADRGAEPRHILSPGFPRNGWSSLRLVLDFDKQTRFHLDIGQNPENAVKVQIYREVYKRTPEGYFPDRLEPISLPYESRPADFSIPAQTTVTFWMDFWVDRKAPVDRIKIEPQVWVASINDWVIYPMEVNILEPTVPDLKLTWATAQPPVTESSDAAILPALRAAFCGKREKSAMSRQDAVNTRDLLRRNTLQHISIASRTRVERTLLETTSYATMRAWCAAAPPKVAGGPEWYLRFRDRLFRKEEISIKVHPGKPKAKTKSRPVGKR